MVLNDRSADPQDGGGLAHGSLDLRRRELEETVASGSPRVPRRALEALAHGVERGALVGLSYARPPHEEARLQEPVDRAHRPACEMRGMIYSQFIDGLNKAGITLNRKQLSEVAIHDPAAFDALVNEAKSAREAALV
jgi:hypothetical protein